MGLLNIGFNLSSLSKRKHCKYSKFVFLNFEFVFSICFKMMIFFSYKANAWCDNDICGTLNLLNLMKAHYIRELLPNIDDFCVDDQ